MTYFKRFVLAVLLFMGTLSLTPVALAAPDLPPAASVGIDRSISAEVLADLRAQLLELLALLQTLTLAESTPPLTSTEGAIAGASVSSASPEALTFRLLAAKKNYDKAAASQKNARSAELRALALERKQALLALIKTNPVAASAIMLSSSITKTLPLDIQPLIETETTLEGDLSVFFQEDLDEEILEYVYTLRTQQGSDIAVHFAEKSDPNVRHEGGHVRIHGMKLDDTILLSSDLTNVQYLTDGQTGTTNPSPSSAVLTNTFGAQNTLVILVNFANDPTNQPITPAAAQDLFFGAGQSASNYHKEASYGQTWLTGNVYGWYTSSVASTTCDMTQLATDAKNAAVASGAVLSQYKRYVYLFPRITTCGWSGMGTVGNTPSETWVNGRFFVKTIDHEMGHNFGLYHSHALECGTAITGIVGSGCTNVDYGDNLDIMGNSYPAHFNAFQKTRLGWIDYNTSPTTMTVATNGTYTINPIETQTADTKALKIKKSVDAAGVITWYYVEFRQGIGFDDFIPTIYQGNIANGVVIRTATGIDAASSFWLDMTPNSSAYDWNDSALVVGQSFSDSAAGVTITPTAVSATAATVQVTFGGGGATCTRANPSITLSPGTQTGTGGQSLTYSATVTNNDSSGCTSSTFGVAPTLPSGWSQSPASLSYTLAPGASQTQSIAVTSPSTATAASYTFSEKATNNGAVSYNATASATYTVGTAACTRGNPSIAVTPTSQSGTAGQALSYSLTVTNTDSSTCTSSTFSAVPTLPSGFTQSPSSLSYALAPGASQTQSFSVTSPATAAAASYNVTEKVTNTAATAYNSSITLTYTVTALACTRANPTLTITPASQWGNAGQGLAYTLALTNNDSSGCTSSTFGIAPTLPAGWSQSPSAPSLTLAPGASANQSVTVTSSATASGGSYAFSEKATNNSATAYTSTVSATYNVNAAVTDTTAPATAITSPLNGAFVPASSVVTITASATDNVGVARVEFFIGGKRKCTDTASPYSCSWSVPKAPNKSYTIQTKAYDAAGNVGSSAFVTVKSQ